MAIANLQSSLDQVESRRAVLNQGVESLGLPLSDTQLTKMLAFIQLIAKWNKAYNLTAIRQMDDMVSLHLLDSLAILPYVQGNRIVDIGTGAGLPGIPLAIALPDTTFVLLDSNAKKTRFVQQAILELKLGNVAVIHSRIEDYQPDDLFDTVLTRAFASLPEIVEKVAHVAQPNGLLLAMKGQVPAAEMQMLSSPSDVIPICVPGVSAERCLVKIKLSGV